VIYDPELLDKLQEVEPGLWAGRVYRYMFGEEPTRPNTRGARWNPAGVAAIYTALDTDTLKAELEYRLQLDVVRPRVSPQLYTIETKLGNVVDLSSPSVLQSLGLTAEHLGGFDHHACQKIGGAAAWLEHDGILVPSARRKGGVNLVMFPASWGADARFEVIESVELPLSETPGE
jgi:RES domain-containing protein